MKLLIKLSLLIVTLLILAIGMLLVIVNPNDYKDEIQAQVKSSINRDLHIKGDIGWTLYPQFGFSSGEIILDNLTTFNKPHLLKIENSSLGIHLLPLLKGEISIAKLTLNGFQLTLLKDKNGHSNLDNMVAKSAAPVKGTNSLVEQSEKKDNENTFFKINKTQLAGININNALIEIDDQQTGSNQKIEIKEIKLGQFSLNKETELTINSKIVIDDLQAELKLTALLLVNSDLSNIKLNKFQLNTELSADALPNGQLTSLLKTDINVAVKSKHISLRNFDLSAVIIADNLPNKKITTHVNADIDYRLESQLAAIKSLNIKVDNNIEIAGDMSIQTSNITKIRYDLIGNKWDLNPYLSKSSSKNSDTTTPIISDSKIKGDSNTKKIVELEPDLSFLHNLDVDGHLKIAGIKVDNLKIGEIKNRLIINKGKAQIKPLTAVLYKGLLTVNGEVDEKKGRNKYKLSTTLRHVQIQPLLIDAADIDLISASTSLNFSGKGQGLTSIKIKRGLIGKGDFKLLDGELYGVNIPQEIRILKAKLSGKKVPSSDAVKKTDFASLTGKFTINKGLINNQKLLMLSPVMRLDGLGLVNILKESLDYKLSISPLSRSKADTDYVDLNGLSIPMLIKGSFTDPKITLDTDGALKDQLKARAESLKKEAKAKLKVEQKRLQEKADKALKKHQDKLDKKTQDKIKKESKRLEDKFKKYF